MRGKANFAGVCCCVLVILFSMSSFSSAKVIYVDDDALAGGDGSSWENAYTFLQDALAEANSSDKPVEVRVAQGIYKPNQGVGITPGDRSATFKLINGVTIKGGFAGIGATEPNTQDVETYETTLSGDLAGNDVEVDDPCDLIDEPNRAENSFHVTVASETVNTAVLDGFTITCGNAYSQPYYPLNNDQNNRGGGMYIYNGSPTISNCTFSNNSSEIFGGGIFNRDLGGHTRPTLINCKFIANIAETKSHSDGYGGGIYNDKSTPIITNCTFSKNKAKDTGGGIYNGGNSTLSNCLFTDNSAGSGGGMFNENSNSILTDCSFKYNSALSGGAIGNIREGNLILTCCDIVNNSAVVGGAIVNNADADMSLSSCVLSENSAEENGGGIYSNLGILTITKCLFVNNSAYTGGGVSCYERSTLTVNNCTFKGNSAFNGNSMACDSSYHRLRPNYVIITNSILWDDGSKIWNRDGSEIKLSYSNIQGGCSAIYDPCSTTVWGTGNIDVDPLFVDSNNGDYHLKSQAGRYDPNSDSWVQDDMTSLCIDAGDLTSPIGYEPFPNGGIINMGAYGGTDEASKTYFGEPVCEIIVAGDINGDCKVDFADFQLMSSHWLEDVQ